ncbi:hypothetical protein Syun_013365 [Stephania yunnanensis]|uniref:Protein kinase domain-containing protein n=1 Tax=Stephania yunnanensis TaxID=152371 RepID=A0AAP0PJS3_9MAGN
MGGESSSIKSKASSKYDPQEAEFIAGQMGDLPITFCDGGSGSGYPFKITRHWIGYLCLREVMRATVQVMGESRWGISEKVVLLDGRMFATKRFRSVSLCRKLFGKRVEKLAQVGKGCESLVQIRAYLYAKRIKVVLCDYHPMGSLADLLDGAREMGHTPLSWDQRLGIIRDVARAISYIHSQSPVQEKGLHLNVHGNIKTSNVMVRTNFSACLSEYGFVQLAEPTEPVTQPEKLTHKNDIYGFGVMVLDMLGGPRAPLEISCIVKRQDEISEGVLGFFEFIVEGRERKQALRVLDLALACSNKFTEARPSMEHVLLLLGDLYSG